MTLIGHPCSRENGRLMGSQTDLYHTQGGLLGAAVEAPCGLRGGALLFAKRALLAANPSHSGVHNGNFATDRQLCQTTSQLIHSEYAYSAVENVTSWRHFQRTPLALSSFRMGRGAVESMQGVVDSILLHVSCLQVTCSAPPRTEHVERIKTASCNLHYYHSNIFFRWVARKCNHISPYFFISEEKH